MVRYWDIGCRAVLILFLCALPCFAQWPIEAMAQGLPHDVTLHDSVRIWIRESDGRITFLAVYPEFISTDSLGTRWKDIILPQSYYNASEAYQHYGEQTTVESQRNFSDERHKQLILQLLKQDTTQRK